MVQVVSFTIHVNLLLSDSATCIKFNACVIGHLNEDFRQPMYLCPVDLRKLQALCGFSVVDRYEGLHKVFHKHGMNEETNWTERRIKFIKDKKLKT